LYLEQLIPVAHLQRNGIRSSTPIVSTQKRVWHLKPEKACIDMPDDPKAIRAFLKANNSLPEKDNLMMQGVHYKMLAKEILGIEDIPFYYFIFNSKNPSDMKIIKQHVDEDRYFFHKINIDKVKNGIEKDLYDGFKPYPNYRKCIECALFEKCEVRAEFPLINEIYY
jgi:hypothetical protein